MATNQPLLRPILIADPERSVVSFTLNRWTLSAICFIGLVLVALAGISVYKFIDVNPQSQNLAYLNSLSTREQEQQKLVQLDEQRLKILQQDNDASKKQFEELESQIATLSKDYNNLQQIAQKVAQLNTSTKPNNAGPSSSASSRQGVKVTPKDNNGSGSNNFDQGSGQAYAAQLNKLSGEMEALNKQLQNSRYNLATLNIQVQGYQTTLTKQESWLQGKGNISPNQLALLDGPVKAKAGTPTSIPGAGAATPGFILSQGSNPPTTIPVNGPVTSLFGTRWSPFTSGVQQMHYGLDLSCPQGTPVAVTKAGVVSYVGYDSGYGNRVEVTHAGGWLTLYGHNSKLLVKVGQVVQQGDIIALSGNTGASTGPHVHYELHQDGLAIDPQRVLNVKLTFMLGVG